MRNNLLVALSAFALLLFLFSCMGSKNSYKKLDNELQHRFKKENNNNSLTTTIGDTTEVFTLLFHPITHQPERYQLDKKKGHYTKRLYYDYKKRTIISQSYYQHGIITGIATQYDSNGKVKSEYNWGPNYKIGVDSLVSIIKKEKGLNLIEGQFDIGRPFPNYSVILEKNGRQYRRILVDGESGKIINDTILYYGD